MRAPLFVLLFLAIAACGPVKSTKTLREADAELKAARAAGAERMAPYEVTGAETYLHQARVEVAHSNYEPAIEYAQRALAFAKKARDKSRRGKPKRKPRRSTRKKAKEAK